MSATPFDCPDCGDTHPKGCHAHTNVKDDNGRITGRRACRAPAVTGLTVCYRHGGSTTTAKTKAAAARTEQAAARELQRGLAAAYGENVPRIDPAEAMLQAVSWKHAEVLALRFKVAGLADDERTWGITKTKDGGDDAGTTREAKPNIWWAMLHTAEEQLVKFAAAARAAKCDEHRVMIAERQGAQVADVVQAILTAMLDSVVTTLTGLGLTDQQIERGVRDAWSAAVGEVVPREFRRLSGGGA